MKPWIRRSVFGVLGAAALVVGLGACSHHRGGGAWGPSSSATESERAEWRARMVDRAADRLKLDTDQKAKLTVLADTLAAERQRVTGGVDLRAEAQSVVAGDRFDRAKAQSLIETKAQAVQASSPAVINAAAEFYDSLKPEQQAQVRDFMARRGGRHAWHS